MIFKAPDPILIHFLFENDEMNNIYKHQVYACGKEVNLCLIQLVDN